MPSIVKLLGLVLLLAGSARSAESQDSPIWEKPAANNASMPQSQGERAAAGEQPAPVSAASLPLAPPGRSVRGGNPGKAGARPGLPSLVSVGSSLALVLGLFFIVAWLMRRTTPGNYPILPGEVVEILGRAPLTARQQVHLLRLGGKLVLICVTPDGVEALSEVVDPAEVDRLAGICRQSQPNSSTALFRQTLQQFTGSRRTEASHG
jgi:flagellar biogenesis protein FliO